MKNNLRYIWLGIVIAIIYSSALVYGMDTVEDVVQSIQGPRGTQQKMPKVTTTPPVEPKKTPAKRGGPQRGKKIKTTGTAKKLISEKISSKTTPASEVTSMPEQVPALVTPQPTPAVTPQPAPTIPTVPKVPTQQPISQPTGILGETMAEVTGTSAAIILPPKRQAFQDLMKDFDSKFGPALNSDVKDALRATIAGEETALTRPQSIIPEAIIQKMVALDERFSEIGELMTTVPEEEQAQWFEILEPLLEDKNQLNRTLSNVKEELTAEEEKTFGKTINNLAAAVNRLKSAINQQQSTKKG